MENILTFPTPSIEAQLARQAGSEKTVLAYYDQDNTLHTFIGDDITHMELVYLIDTLKSRADKIFSY